MKNLLHLRLLVGLALTLGAVGASRARCEDRTVFVPLIRFQKSIGAWQSVEMFSQIAGFNTSESVASTRLTRVYTSQGGQDAPPWRSWTLEPRGGLFDSLTPVVDNVEFGAIRMSPGVDLNVFLVRWFYETNPLDPISYSMTPQGRLALPIFDGLFPAGSLAVSGDVVPYNYELILSSRRSPRTINLTLLNGGHESARFRVRVTHPYEHPSRVVMEASYDLAAESVRQINSLVEVPVPPEYGGPVPNLWVEISADQPFLSYVSTSFEDPHPGSIWYEILPSRLR